MDETEAKFFEIADQFDKIAGLLPQGETRSWAREEAAKIREMASRWHYYNEGGVGAGQSRVE
jgi:hypothetical protein